ncbi:MAG: hypothetical protein ACXW32_07225, partial [Limisphaerales bacterium]
DAEKMQELALRQKDAVEFGKIYEKALAAATNATMARIMTAAIKDMENAQGLLEQQNAKVALAPEESALARLYKIVGMMPELQDLPTVPPPPPVETAEKEEEEQKVEEPLLAVVLEEIKKMKKEEPQNEELSAALEEVKRLQEEQASLTLGIQPSEGESKSKKPPGGGGGQTAIDRSGKKKASPTEAEEMKLAANEKPESKAAKESKAQGKKAQAAKAKAKNGQGKGEGEGKAGKAEAAKKAAAAKAAAKKAESGSKPGEKAGDKGKNGEGEENEPQENESEQQKDELAQREAELSKEAKVLAEKLQRMAGKDARIGHGIPKEISEAGEKMGDAASAMSQGETETAGVHGAQASASLQKAAVLLENALLGRAQRVDVSKEDAPKQYEVLISEYFKALSYDN